MVKENNATYLYKINLAYPITANDMVLVRCYHYNKCYYQTLEFPSLIDQE